MNSGDPKFVEELLATRKSGNAAVPPLPKRLMRKRTPDFFKVSFKKSLFLHGGLFLTFIMGSVISTLLWESEKDLEIARQNKAVKTAIRVDIVDLPSMKLDDMKDIDLSKEVGASPPAEKDVPTPETPLPVSAKAMKDPHKKTVSAADRLKELREKTRSDARRQELMSRLKGKKGGAEGRPVVAGNQLSEGASLTGNIATEADAYNSKLQAHLNRHWRLTDQMLSTGLSARILVKLSADGRIAAKKFLLRSANENFNASVEQALRDAEPFPPPPSNLSRIYLEDGIEWGFPK